MNSTYSWPTSLLSFGSRINAMPGARRIYRTLAIGIVALLALRVFGLS